MQLCQDLHFRLDPHTTNYIFTQNPDTKKEQITIIDTEDFITMIGVSNNSSCTSHTQWYLYLVGKYMHDTLGKMKA